MTTQAISPHESSCLYCKLVPLLPGHLCDLSKKLAFVPVVSALTDTHRDCLDVKSSVKSQRYSALYLEVKSFPLTSHNRETDEQTDNYMYSLILELYRAHTPHAHATLYMYMYMYMYLVRPECQYALNTGI